ncbi:hypothetical protein JCM9279_006576 [Rhodotorula babjevae]
MPRSPSPAASSHSHSHSHSTKRRRYDDDGGYHRDRPTRSHRDYDRSSHGSSRRHDDSPRSVDSHRSPTHRDRDRDRDRDYDRDRDRDRRRRDDDSHYSSDRSSRRRDDRDRDYSSRHERDYARRDRSPDPRDRRAPTNGHAHGSRSPAAVGSPAPPAAAAAAAAPSAADEEKQRLKREKLEAWKRKKAADAAVASPGPASPAPASPAPPRAAPPAAAAAPAAAGLPPKPVAAIHACAPRSRSLALLPLVAKLTSVPASPAALPAKPLSAPSLPLPPSTSKPAGTPADATAAAAAAAAAIANRLSSLGGGAASSSSSAASPAVSLKHALPASLPAKPAFSLGSAATSAAAAAAGRPAAGRSLGADDDEGGRRMGMIRFDDVEGGVEVGAQPGAGAGAAEGDEDEDEDSDLDEEGAAYRARANAVRAARMAALLGAEKEAAAAGVKKEDEGDEDEVKMDVDEPPSAAGGSAKVEDEEDEEEDELEAFMKGVQKQVRTVDKADAVKLGRAPEVLEAAEPGEDDVDEEEDELAKVGMSAADILALAAKKVKKGRELAVPDHKNIDYLPFRKAFYTAPPEVEQLTPDEVDALRLELDDIKIRGAEPPKPATKWSYFGLPAACIDVIKQLEYAAPTSIQAQAIPAIMSGRDIIGVAKTGSGKTMAFILPMFRHIKDQPPLRPLDGPVAMIMTPTRELATQIYKECKPFLKALGLRASCAYGGMPLKDNIADMKRGSEVIVCTPGRMIELLTTNSGRLINLQRVTYLVLDEADRMFDMGFEPQVMKILGQIRPDRQTVLFSATFPRQMEALARKVLRRPLEITVGGRSVVADTITQVVEVRPEESKFNRTLELLGQLFNDESDARALIFVERQESADKLFVDLQNKNYTCMPLHGGREQVDRDQTIVDFKNGSCPIVIATSVAARGLDVKQLKLVVQYDVPNHMEDYVHRAGRTGRAGNTGTCVTFITPDQERYAVDILKALTASKAPVPPELEAMAQAFADKVKAGKAQAAGSGFGGKGLDRLDNERDAASRAERAAYGETAKDDKKGGEGGDEGDEGEQAAKKVADLEVQIHRGPAPNLEKGKMIPSASSAAAPAAPVVDAKAAEAAAKKAEQEALAAGKSAGVAGAASVIAKFNAMLKAKQSGHAAPVTDHSTEAARRRDPDATDYHAIVWINDYPQKARWKVTNKDTMVHLVDSTGASITNKGIFYEPGKEPGPNDLPKLHLLIESNEEFRVQHAIAEIKKALIEGATMALEAEQRQQAGGGGGAAIGRYSVV